LSHLVGNMGQAKWTNKKDLCRRLLKLRELGWREVLFIDDNQDECFKVSGICQTLWVRAGSGINDNDMQHMVRMAVGTDVDPSDSFTFLTDPSEATTLEDLTSAGSSAREVERHCLKGCRVQ